jgi:hypothetical protein
MNNLARTSFLIAVFGVGTAVILSNHRALANGQADRSAASPAETSTQGVDPLAPGSAQLINPEDLLAILQSAQGPKPLILNVGPHLIYMQAHIPGAEFIGSASDSQRVESLRRRVKPLPRNTFIILYCGCCPWSHCPNVHPAYRELEKEGFTNVKVLYIADDFGADWVNKGYPTVKGQ